ncbi:MAG: proline dehydrogenase family protein [Saprospiraceae bacterium]
MSNSTKLVLDFDNTENAFSVLSNSELKQSAWLFGMMKNATLVNLGSRATMLALKFRLPITWAIKRTIYEQFCGGSTLKECVPDIDKMAKYGVTTMLDYGTEGKQTESDFNKTMRFTNDSILFAEQNETVQVVVVKLTGLMEFRLLEKLQNGERLNPREQKFYETGLKRIDSICRLASEKGVQIYIDAEESWIQDPVDNIALDMMRQYNKEKAIVFNTYQMYRHDRLAFLKKCVSMAKAEQFIMAAKVVRGAYIDKERARAKNKGYPSPIQPNKATTDKDYNEAMLFCVENYEFISVCAATHNAESSLLLANKMEEEGIPRNHPHFTFCQLYGMSDNLTFNLSKAGFTASKYLVYGPVKDVLPYLVRRAQENSSVTGEVGRELGMIKKEIKRRGI